MKCPVCNNELTFIEARREYNNQIVTVHCDKCEKYYTLAIPMEKILSDLYSVNDIMNQDNIQYISSTTRY